MDQRLIDLYVQRGRLRERIASQRGQLADALQPLGTALQTVDRGRTLARQAQVWLTAHPGLVTVAVVTWVVWRPRSVLRTARWAFSLWRSWAQVRDWTRTGLRTR